MNRIPNSAISAIFAILLLSSYVAYAALASLGESALQEIVDQEEALWAQLDSPDCTLTEEDVRTRGLEIQRSYQRFVDAHSNHFEGLVLYGKFLRKIGSPELAHSYFQKAAALNPNVAVVQQQLANYYAEQGLYNESLNAVNKAIELAPNEAIYYYQLGELLYIYKVQFLKDPKWDIQQWDCQMLEAFKKAHCLNPQNQSFEFRYAQSFFDLYQPQWPLALKVWSNIEHHIPPGSQQEYVFIQKARILIELSHFQEAKKYLNRIWRPELEHDRRLLLKRIPETS